MDIEHEVAVLHTLTVGQLQARYAAVFGTPPRGRHRQWLIRRIAWCRQAQEEGGLSERARRRARELANEADLRLTPPKGPHLISPPAEKGAGPADGRLPMPGTVLTRLYKGHTVVVLVRPDGFECRGQVFSSLSAVAKAITGSHWNGFHFFGLRRPKEDA